jgi:hypothetical protein
MSGAGEVGRRQPAQRPTIAQDGAFLNKPITATCYRVLEAGWRPEPVHTCCPTDWPVCARPSRVDAPFAADIFAGRAIADPGHSSSGVAQRAESRLCVISRGAFKVRSIGVSRWGGAGDRDAWCRPWRRRSSVQVRHSQDGYPRTSHRWCLRRASEQPGRRPNARVPTPPPSRRAGLRGRCWRARIRLTSNRIREPR